MLPRGTLTNRPEKRRGHVGPACPACRPGHSKGVGLSHGRAPFSGNVLWVTSGTPSGHPDFTSKAVIRSMREGLVFTSGKRTS